MSENRLRPEADPRRHTEKIRGLLEGLIDHLRDDVSKVSEPRAQVLFETTAEVLLGLKTAFEHYEAGTEAAFEPKSAAMAGATSNPDGLMGES